MSHFLQRSLAFTGVQPHSADCAVLGLFGEPQEYHRKSLPLAVTCRKFSSDLTITVRSSGFLIVHCLVKSHCWSVASSGQVHYVLHALPFNMYLK